MSPAVFPAPVGGYYPTSVLVGIAWLQRCVPEIVAAELAAASGMVGPSLPSDPAAWPYGAFITVNDDRGGSDYVDIPVRRPLLRVSVWAASAGSNEPPRKRAAQIAECIRQATYSRTTFGKSMTMPTGYRAARVQAAFIPEGTSMRSILNDPSGYARVDIDLEVDWAVMP